MSRRSLLPAWKAMIFDLDGVLFRSSAIHETAYRQVLRRLGRRPFRYEDVAGMETEEAFRLLSKSRAPRRTSRDIRRWTREKREIAFRLIKKAPPLYPGCRKILQRLAEKFVLALVSSSSRRNVRLFLSASGTGKLFSVVLSGEDARRAKPAPDLYVRALQQLKLPARDAVVIEDAVQGVRAARRAGIPVMALSSSPKNRRALRRAGAFRLIRRLEQLTASLETS